MVAERIRIKETPGMVDAMVYSYRMIMLIKEQAGGKMKTLDLVKEYGGIDEVIEEVRRFTFDLTPEFTEVLLYALEDYKRLKQRKNKQRNIGDGSWPDLPKIGDRHEMGG